MKSLNNFFWSLYALCYDVLLVFGPYIKMFNQIIEKLQLDRGENLEVLDAGCGTGNLEFLLKKRGYSSLNIKALDFSKIMLKRAKKKNREYADFKYYDISKQLPFSDNSFDMIISVNVFHLLSNPNEVLSEFFRILKPGGKLFLVVLKKDYKMTSILKSWKHEKESFDKWNVTGLFSWFRLVFKSFGFNFSALKFIFVAIFNKIIDKKIEGFDYNHLLNLFISEGFLFDYHDFVYGGQEHFFIFRKTKVSIKLIKNIFELKEAINIRKKVFFEEFGIPEESELDLDSDFDKNIDFFIVNNDNKRIGTFRLKKFTTPNNFKWLFPSNSFDQNDFFPCLEISRFSLLKEHRDGKSIFIALLLAHMYAKSIGFNYFRGAMRVELLNLLKRANIIFEDQSEEIDYYKKWKILAFVSSVERNLETLNRLSLSS